MTQIHADPLNEVIAFDSFVNEQQKLKEKTENLNLIPHLPLLILISLSTLPIIALLPMYMLQLFETKAAYYGWAASFFPVFGYFGYIQGLENDLALYLLCQQNNWAFNPKEDAERATRLAEHFPDIFNRGHDDSIEDQIWGSLPEKQNREFWSAIFTYTEGSGRNSTTYQQQVFIIELDKELPIDFTLTGNSLELIKGFQNIKFISNFLNYKTTKTESEEFNKLYQIKYNSTDPETERKILQVLSPSLQVRLIDFAHDYSIASISFQKNSMIILFNDELWQSKYTNFFKHVMIDERDESKFQETVSHMFTISEEMMKFLD